MRRGKHIAGFGRNTLALLHDIVMAAVSFILSVALRLGPDQLEKSSNYIIPGTVIFTLVCVLVFSFMGVYRSLWRYTSVHDVATIVKSVTLSVLVFAVIMFLHNRLEDVPRSIFFINWLLLFFLTAGPRFIYRALKEQGLKLPHKKKSSIRIPVLLIGANDNAERFIRDMKRDARGLYEPVAIVDDRPKRRGHMIHDVPIYGGADNITSIIERLEQAGMRPQKLIITDPRSSAVCINNLLDVCEQLGITMSRLPKPGEIRSGVSERLDIQPIAVEDLLGRSQNILDRQRMKSLVTGKKVLITGAGGTIGGELTRQIASYNPHTLIIFELSEFNLYQIEREIRGSYPELHIISVLADVRDKLHVDRIFDTHKPQLVFHAAAVKHVPIAEENVEETILTNVFGTRNIAEAALRCQTEIMLMISTDKAVNPTNVMGASKRLAESICQTLGRSQNGNGFKTHFATVRFGNVLGSTGSVVPLFQEQLAGGGPITVTHPEMTRYFMTVREAVELVLQAAALGDSMEDRAECIFVLDMGQPVRIVDLAQQMIRLAGFKPHEDIKIIYTGLRPGEKLYEELFHFSENAIKTSHEGIFLASPRISDPETLRKGLEHLLELASGRSGDSRAILRELVPEFQPAHRQQAE